MYGAAGDDRAWTSEAHLLAHAVDVLNGANWQRGDGKGKKPDPIARPSQLAEQARRAERNLDRARRFRERQTREG